jgi:DNA polymerase III alpha subunit
MPQDHIDYAVKNGSDALALTDHGNMNGFSYQYLHAKKLKDKGVPFKALSGVEAYYIPSLSEWRKLKTAQDEAKAAEKEAKKLAANPDSIGDELASAKAELEEMAGVVKTDEDEEGGTVVENEDDSKSNKYRDPIQRRNHLVLLPKNTAGLKTLFRLVSNSYIDGFYKYPRIDLDMLKREAKGNIIALSACIAGADMHIIASHQTEPDYHKWSPNNVNFELIQSELKDMIYAFKDALGEENYYLEAQFNALNAQHLKNFHIMEAAKRTNTNLVVTCDSHYSNPDHWRERELYKAMAWASKSKEGVDTSKLPQKIEELKCELYPKNAQQIWNSYKTYSAGYDFYNDDVIRQAIERTWDIAHNQIGSVDFDRSVKLPVIEKLVSKTHLESSIEKLGEGADEDVLAFEELKR